MFLRGDTAYYNLESIFRPLASEDYKTVASETLIKVVLQTVEVNTKEEGMTWMFNDRHNVTLE
jgi:hypothetical protein